MADYSDLDPSILKASLTDGNGNLKPSITTSSYTGGIPSSAADLKASIRYPDGRLKWAKGDGSLKDAILSGVTGGGGGGGPADGSQDFTYPIADSIMTSDLLTSGDTAYDMWGLNRIRKVSLFGYLFFNSAAEATAFKSTISTLIYDNGGSNYPWTISLASATAGVDGTYGDYLASTSWGSNIFNAGAGPVTLSWTI